MPLLLLDSYVEENEPALHEVTDRLYGGGSEHRLRQELLLGIGGVRAVRAFCAITGHPEPEVFHTNEGHAGFLGLERISEYVAAGLDFDEALELCRAGTVFTTHTPVPAGIDRFPRELVERYFAADAAGCTLPLERVLALGAETYPGGDPARLQHGRDGHAARAAGQRRLRAARPGQPRDVRRPVARVRHLRGADRLDHQRRARADLGRQGGLRPRRLRLRRVRGRRAAVGDPAAAAGPAGHRDQAAAARVLAPARRVRRRADLDRRRPRRERADDRVRPAGPVLQAADADAERPAAAHRAAARPGPADPDRDRGQGATRPTRAASGSSSRWSGSRTRNRAPPDRLPAGLRHGAGALPGAGLSTSG